MQNDILLKELAAREVGSVFADPASAAARRWMDYWSSTETRNRELLAQFHGVASFGLKEKTVLDLGCGTAGLAAAVAEEGGRYCGIDYSPYVLQMGRRLLGEKGLNGTLMRASGTQLPFRDESFDYIFAFDVIEHMDGGLPAQLGLLRELRRVIRPMGMIFLTTPNKRFPFEGHTFLYFPQYLPAPLADMYIRLCNPGFLDEHGSFRSIKLLAPGELKRLLRQSGLAFLHQLPCCADIADLPWHRRLVYRLLQTAGASWHPMQEFWGCLARREHRGALRTKLIKHHSAAFSEGLPAGEEFSDCVDFSLGAHAHQLGAGWFSAESGGLAYRWTGEIAEIWLQAAGDSEFLELGGYFPQARPQATMSVFCDGEWIGEHRFTESGMFRFSFLLARPLVRSQICKIRLEVSPVHVPGGADQRRLGVALSRVGLAG
jgi:SAM-dependent methyltransferase